LCIDSLIVVSFGMGYEGEASEQIEKLINHCRISVAAHKEGSTFKDAGGDKVR